MTDSNDTKMIATQNAEAVKMLEALLAEGALASQYEAYINGLRHGKDTFYTRLLAEEGKDAAEAAIAKWNRRDRMSDYATAIELVARGMLALAKIDSEGEYTKVVDVQGHNFPLCYDIHGPSKMVVVFNRPAPGCGCNQPDGSEDWGIYGSLGLKAVTLQAGHDYRGLNVAQLGLVLPQRALSAKNMSEDGFTVATINLAGDTDGHLYSPHGFYRDAYLNYSLGLIGMDRAIRRSNSSGGLGEAIGFPGATDYLANALPNLGKYFAHLATMLTSDHEH
jgi:hypothetical protein